MLRSRSHLFYALPVFIMMLVLCTACGGSATPPTDGGIIPTTTATSTQPTVSTDCPAANTGRAAVRPDLSGTHTADNVVYVRKEGNTSYLLRYDVAAHQETEILHVDGKIAGAELSTNGNWVTFIYQPTSGADAVQMVRVDGTSRQTLYCSQSDNEKLFDSAISPDQHYMAFMEGPDLSSAPIKLLDLNNGSVQIELVAAHPGAISGMPSFWLDSTHLYLTGFVPNSDALPQNIYLLNTAHGANQTMSSVSLVLSISGLCYRYSSRATGHILYVSDCHHELSMGAPSPTQGPSYIHSMLALDGTGNESLLETGSDAITSVASISDIGTDNILYTIGDSSGGAQNGLYVISNQGGKPRQLLSLPTASDSVAFSDKPDYEHSITSYDAIDSASFVVKETTSTGKTSICVGSISGTGTITTIATTNDPNSDLTVVGWTRY